MVTITYIPRNFVASKKMFNLKQRLLKNCHIYCHMYVNAIYKIQELRKNKVFFKNEALVGYLK